MNVRRAALHVSIYTIQMLLCCLLRYALFLQLSKHGGSPDLDIKVRLEQSPAVAWRNEQYTQTSFQSEIELLSRQQEDADPAWFEAAFGEVQVKAVAAVEVHVQRVKFDWNSTSDRRRL